jgi:hypothetical protein
VKAHGGLWTSTYHPAYGSDWVREANGMFGWPKEGVEGFLLFPSPEARIYTVDSLDDLMGLHERYEAEDTELSHMFKVLDYEKMSQDYDGMHLTERGQWETRLSHPYSLYGWDCECVYWFRWCFDEVRSIGKIYVPEEVE